MQNRLRALALLLIIVVLSLTSCTTSVQTAATQLSSPGESTEISLVASSTPKPATKTAVPAATATTASSAPVSTETSNQPAVCEPTGKLLQPDPAYPPVSDQDWVDGPADAEVTIIEYSEFQCPYCAMLEPELLKLREAYPDDVRLVFRHFPLDFHDKAYLSAQAAEAIGKQKYDLFFVFKNFLFEKRDTWVNMTPDQYKSWLLENVTALGADKDQFAKDLESQEIVNKVKEAVASGEQSGVQGTPTVLFNGVPYGGPRDFATLEGIVKLFQLENNLYEACPPMEVQPDKEYVATIKTTKGEIIIQLLAAQAPMAVNSFIFLAKDGYYDNTPFHRVLPNFVAQAGDPSGTGYGGPGYRFSNEISPELKFDSEGVLGMANSGTPDSNGSQFFITYAALPQLDGNYTIFGKVIGGMDVVKNLTPRDPNSDQLLPEPDLILSITIEEK